MHTRPTTADDIAQLQTILEGTELFPSEMLPEMIDGFFNDPESADIWISAEIDGKVAGFCYAAPEMLAPGAWNMLAIAVDPHSQGQGCGAEIVKALETCLASDGQRILIVDTSSDDAFAKTRRFYEANGYAKEAQIRDYWGPGDDKIIFWKAMT